MNTDIYLLTEWCRVLLVKLTGLQLVKKFPTFLWNPKVHYNTHKRPSPVPILGQPNPAHIPTFHLLEIHPNIIHPSTPRSTQSSISLRFPHQDPIRPPFLTHTRQYISTHFTIFHEAFWTEWYHIEECDVISFVNYSRLDTFSYSFVAVTYWEFSEYEFWDLEIDMQNTYNRSHKQWK